MYVPWQFKRELIRARQNAIENAVRNSWSQPGRRHRRTLVVVKAARFLAGRLSWSVFRRTRESAPILGLRRGPTPTPDLHVIFDGLTEEPLRSTVEVL